ncbi:cytochrome P450 302a1, mitochondrial-like [Daphnia magna]|uniref:cytochrome P450 302a1, mitochondrial-like n=1 Tax=Daphnia magna TaxID=35525 RepID=UPI001E1BCB09|nr:cytochrome P450 302a1, mitochondrial-like [Daphnia magna]
MFEVSHENLINEDLISGEATETQSLTGNATVFLLHDILNNPEVKVRVYEELDRVFLSPEDAKTPPLLLKFKYLKVFITESLRMTPVAPNVARILENRLSFKVITLLLELAWKLL